jgi:predicted glycosyltransferase involved in capsule biosynthesis
MLRLILATFPMEEIEERHIKSQEQKSGKNKSENQVNEKHFSTSKEVIQSKQMDVLMQIKSLQGVKIIQTSSQSLEDWGDLSLLSSLL